MVNNLCGYLGLLMWDSESYSGTDDPANVGVDTPIYPILDLGLICPTIALITTLGIQLLPLDLPSFLYQNQHSFYRLFFLLFIHLLHYLTPWGTCSCLASPFGDASRYTDVLVYF